VNIYLLAVVLLLLGYITFDGSNEHADDSEEAVESTQQINQKEGDPITYSLPESFTFAGEPVPLDDPDVRERFDREIHVNAYWHSNTIFVLKRAHRWLPQIEKILKEHDIPTDFKYLPLIESDLENKVSYRGATGFWQLRDITAKELGLEVNSIVDERYNPLKSTEAAIKYLRKAYNRFGSWTNVAASYNIGQYGLHRRLRDQEVSSYYDLLLNEETARYVFRILAIKEIYENPVKYGFYIPEDHLYAQEELVLVEVDESISDLVDFAKDQNITYKILKRHNPWLRTDRLRVTKGKTYEVAIPASKFEFSKEYPVKRVTGSDDDDSIRFLKDTLMVRTN